MRKRSSGIILALLLVVLGITAYLGYSLWRDFGPEIGSLPKALTTATDQGFRFYVVGDPEGDTPVFRRIIEEMKSQPAAFLLVVGDLTARAEPDDFRAVKELLDTLPFPYYTAVGNNDIYGDRERSQFRRFFPAPETDLTYYRFDYQSARFVVLDNADRKVGFDDAQLAWLQSTLKDGQPRWTFIIAHRPVDVPLTDVFGDDETTASRQANAKFSELIGQSPINRIFSGHIHSLFSYSLGDIPVTITGGGGAEPQAAIASLLGPQFHYLEIKVTSDGVTQTVKRIKSE